MNITRQVRPGVVVTPLQNRARNGMYRSDSHSPSAITRSFSVAVPEAEG
jgi:hypothetical protein